MPVDHYENFPVASLLLPAHLRPAVEVIYAFARSADDLADEGDATPEKRLAALAEYEEQLDFIRQNHPPVMILFQDLARIVYQYDLPLQPFYDLLSAFKQDVSTVRYADFDALIDYCHRSADPVGQLMLHLYQASSPQNLHASNSICSALQLINFWQDIAIDWKKGRIYLPLEDLHRFNITEDYLEEEKIDENWRALMKFEINRARSLILSGSSLALILPGRIGWELRLVIQGGLHILERIEAVDYDIFRHRPKLGKRDWLQMAWRSLRMKHEKLA